MAIWEHRKLSSAEEASGDAPAVPPVEAQAWCNFVLWTPASVPSGCWLADGTLRREAPPGEPEETLEGRGPWDGNHLASYRFEVIGEGRRLRVKQFLYDWAFPALDQPCLWKSETRALPIDDRHVVWRGTDYMGKEAASARLARTTIELSVLEGSFSDEELLAFYRDLKPADAAALEAIAATPHAVLSYWARRPDAVQLIVPVGMWVFRRGAHEARWTSGVEADALAASWSLPLGVGGLPLDSAATITHRGGEELEAIYAGGGPQRGAELRLIAQRPGEGALTVPAAPEPHPATHDASDSRQLAWIDPRYGPFQAVFTTPDGLEATLLSTTGVGLDRAWFDRALRDL